MTQELSSDGKPAVGDPTPQPSHPVLVVPDTNVLTSNYLLQTAAGSALADVLSRGNGRILLPEVIEIELKNVLGRKLAEDAAKAADRLRGLEAIIQKDIVRVPDATDLNAAIGQRLAELDPLLLREPFTLEIAQAALMRVIEKRPPSGSNNEQFRDCCIWEHCLRLGKRYDVHLVTADGAFYEGKKLEDGLAKQLRSELKGESASVFAYPTLPKLVEHLAESVPPRDAERLGRAIGEVARHMLAPHADAAGFILGDLTHSRVSIIPTKMPLNLLGTFDLTYLLVEKTEQDAQVRLSPQLTASGSCALRAPEEVIHDLRIDESAIQWTDLSGKTVTQRHHYLYPASASLSSSALRFREAQGLSLPVPWASSILKSREVSAMLRRRAVRQRASASINARSADARISSSSALYRTIADAVQGFLAVMPTLSHLTSLRV